MSKKKITALMLSLMVCGFAFSLGIGFFYEVGATIGRNVVSDTYECTDILTSDKQLPMSDFIQVNNDTAQHIPFSPTVNYSASLMSLSNSTVNLCKS